jgi:hypothetical protein
MTAGRILCRGELLAALSSRLPAMAMSIGRNIRT